LNDSKKIFEIFFEFGKILKTNFSPLLKKFCKKTSKACYYPNPLFGSIKKTQKKSSFLIQEFIGQKNNLPPLSKKKVEEIILVEHFRIVRQKQSSLSTTTYLLSI